MGSLSNSSKLIPKKTPRYNPESFNTLINNFSTKNKSKSNLQITEETLKSQKSSKVWKNYIDEIEVHTSLSSKKPNLYPHFTEKMINVVDIINMNLLPLKQLHFEKNMGNYKIADCKWLHFGEKGKIGSSHLTKTIFPDYAKKTHDILLQIETRRTALTGKITDGFHMPYYKTCDVSIKTAAQAAMEATETLQGLAAAVDKHSLFYLIISITNGTGHILANPNFDNFDLYWHEIIVAIELAGVEPVDMAKELKDLLDILRIEIYDQQGVTPSEVIRYKEAEIRFLSGLLEALNNIECKSWEEGGGKTCESFEYLSVKEYDKLIDRSIK